MPSAVLPFPVLPGKTESDIRKIADRFKEDPAGYREARAGTGMTLERAYWQHTPMGDFVVAYIESSQDVGAGLATMAQNTSDMGRYFVETVNEVHGVDITQPPSGPGPEIVGEWSDPDATGRGRGMAFCAPVIPEHVEYGRRWAQEAFETRKDEFTRSRRALGQVREVVCLNHTPHGPVCGVYLEGADPFDANRRFADSQDPFDLWFKQQLKVIFPPFIDFDRPTPGVTEIFDSLAL